MFYFMIIYILHTSVPVTSIDIRYVVKCLNIYIKSKKTLKNATFRKM